ncbi:MAG TPA: aminotransferase class V-fold PLP-dependent enzyme, partial [Spirochaetia bacterium]|nr:aminotransferase class V-fold PLP-dependent enzyme [Spirochaetia bacterium]
MSTGVDRRSADDVYSIARILHRGGALACFDFAALAPYERIDVDRDEESYFDALFFSPHKSLGGLGSSGVLIIHDHIYRRDLPPTHGGGGTVDFVSGSQQDYLTNIEGREMAGTPGIHQAWKVALAMELKERMDPEERIGILSFLVRDRTFYLHPRFVARLLNDLFGIQSHRRDACTEHARSPSLGREAPLLIRRGGRPNARRKPLSLRVLRGRSVAPIRNGIPFVSR